MSKANVPSRPVIAVVIPSYNQGHFIKQTIDSILCQPGVTTDVVVMDGGSTDSTVAVLKKYGKRITWFSQKDKGQSDAINKGVTYFLKKYREQENVLFAYLNSDDYYAPLALQQVVSTFQQNPQVSWVVGECSIVDESGRSIQSWIQTYKRWWRVLLSWQLLLVLNPIPQPAVFMRLSAVRTTGLFATALRYTMDYEYWLRLWRAVGRPLVLNHTLAAFRIHGQSKGSTQFEKQFAEQFLVAQQLTGSSAWLLIQSVHNRLITLVYHLIK